MRAADRDAAHLAVQRALQSMSPAVYRDVDETYYNLSSAQELVAERLFEVPWSDLKVEDWISAEFVAPDAAALYAAWVAGQLNNAKAQVKAEAAPTVTPIRYGQGFLIAGDRLAIKVRPSAGHDQIDVDVSATAKAIAEAMGRDRDRGACLGLDERLSFEPDEIRIEGDVLTCAAQSPFMARYAPTVTDYREGFTVTLEPGQANAVRQAVAQLRRVLAGYQAVAEHLRPWFSGEPDTWNVLRPVFHLVVARVLDGADHAAALAAFDEAALQLPPDARPRVAAPAFWEALDRAAGPQP